MAPPVYMTSPAFERLSSPLGFGVPTPTLEMDSPFDKALDARDRAVYSWVMKITGTPSPAPDPDLASKWVPEVNAMYAAVFPGHGEFGPGGGPLL